MPSVDELTFTLTQEEVWRLLLGAVASHLPVGNGGRWRVAQWDGDREGGAWFAVKWEPDIV